MSKAAKAKKNVPVVSKLEADARKAAEGVNDNESEEFKKAMRKEARALVEQFNEEKKLLAFYQQERQKINYNWIIAKKELEDKKSELINKEREIQDLQENHFMTLNVYKQKIKHLLFQNQDQQSELKKDVEVTLKQLEDQHRIKSRELKTDVRSLKVTKKEQEISQQDYLFALKSEHDKQMTLMRQDYERQVNDIKRKYDLKMQNLTKEMEEARAAMIKQLEDNKNQKIAEIIKEHTQKYNDIKNYYSEITATNLDYRKTLKNEIKELQTKDEEYKKTLQQTEKGYKELNEPLQALGIEIIQLKKQDEEQEAIIKEKEELKQKIDNQERLFRKLEYEYEVKLQQFQYLERERNALYAKFNQTVFEIHQKSGLENLILEKKVTNLREDLEIKDLQIHQVLTAANIDPNSVGSINKSLEEVESLKNELISELQAQLKQIRKAHSHMVKAYEGKLSEFVIPVEELGFDPLVPTNTD
ncbi:growth-arrest-specific microtubule-binding protein (macronuclear) [Tetrahymena thermophila SB210]|uniref:Growth-arrest-specific microtubule-binding protein n=1 Tax=Tetrahymena thermophila (strain SB210) TaxID=312017 RepID=I7LT80_TETTS|nr:growth-arrest-specific microtubule-binding protein [Tetrahymena thermophila SB210]EAR84655.2 growth-arrest-specific microtubule-binding protein [Tetrahymena thermophila SB210]8TEK_D Chain D, Growth-arrest-specific microtubule-binding protein [Tetrahymena thermophila]8TH8_D Chain D, Growth-arrest-specific microtubule-binding protein [Tetrahymena thermophila]8TID_D Chain D, Growth-arrest-specific microtubule-binding protein [Tetrahymena thermophila]|eukprot:XP_001032318.2 growth-arrest-specific microtubule-binding protein [Tetrahymena thermophila SB210]